MVTERRAAAEQVALERARFAQARLEGVRLAAREVAHLLNNDLAGAVGMLELLQRRQGLPPQLGGYVEAAQSALSAAATHVDQLTRVTRVETKDTPVGPALDLERSAPVPTAAAGAAGARRQ